VEQIVAFGLLLIAAGVAILIALPARGMGTAR
jgi:hypothetical protein